MPRPRLPIRIIFVAMTAACATALTGASAVAQGHATAYGGTRAASSTWGKAEKVPGTAALNQGGDAQVRSVSCAAAGNCSAGGLYFGQLQPT